MLSRCICILSTCADDAGDAFEVDEHTMSRFSICSVVSVDEWCAIIRFVTRTSLPIDIFRTCFVPSARSFALEPWLQMASNTSSLDLRNLSIEPNRCRAATVYAWHVSSWSITKYVWRADGTFGDFHPTFLLDKQTWLSFSATRAASSWYEASIEAGWIRNPSLLPCNKTFEYTTLLIFISIEWTRGKGRRLDEYFGGIDDKIWHTAFAHVEVCSAASFIWTAPSFSDLTMTRVVLLVNIIGFTNAVFMTAIESKSSGRSVLEHVCTASRDAAPGRMHCPQTWWWYKNAIFGFSNVLW